MMSTWNFPLCQSEFAQVDRIYHISQNISHFISFESNEVLFMSLMHMAGS